MPDQWPGYELAVENSKLTAGPMDPNLPPASCQSNLMQVVMSVERTITDTPYVTRQGTHRAHNRQHARAGPPTPRSQRRLWARHVRVPKAFWHYAPRLVRKERSSLIAVQTTRKFNSQCRMQVRGPTRPFLLPGLPLDAAKRALVSRCRVADDQVATPYLGCILPCNDGAPLLRGNSFLDGSLGY